MRQQLKSICILAITTMALCSVSCAERKPAEVSIIKAPAFKIESYAATQDVQFITASSLKEPVVTPAVAAELYFGDEGFNGKTEFVTQGINSGAYRQINVKNKGPSNKHYSELGYSMKYMRPVS